MTQLPQTIRWNEGTLYLLDQTKLPLEVVEEKQETAEQIWNSIEQLKVRGAPAIGVAGAYGLLVAIQKNTGLNKEEFLQKIEEKADYLDSARPTAVNLKWALDRMQNSAKLFPGAESKDLYKHLEEEAIRIHEEDVQLCLKMGVNGVGLIKEGMGVLTHCNAGALATTGIGTATAPMYLAHQSGVKFRVYADETRPLLQGARLTSWELQQSGLDVTLLTDNMAAHIMSKGLIDLVITGTDRVAANGDVANKIGTHGVAILAKYFGIPFYVACPYSTIDLNTTEGSEIVIEERKAEEVTHFGLRRTAPEKIKTCNPAFDVTPKELVTGLITEKGIIRAPFGDNLSKEYL
ncbi:MAG: S-methyl-5-thioribose-1-phosphate isomerase [SAR324 cluster bacterium]|nr:S-methyl-5-thioribose-1-phosphate isomerase [SAR324 cluster bacterium]MBL7034518.1 S-methyl-5-thioribose-1-phosphate isomerase [SAR324 cluster bacterium]